MINQETVGNKVLYTIEILRAKNFSTKEQGNVVFDAKVNGVTIYNMVYRDGIKNGKHWKLIDFPKVKGKDNKYYNRVWFPVSTEMCDTVEEALKRYFMK